MTEKTTTKFVGDLEGLSGRVNLLERVQPEFHQQEVEKVFRRGWLIVACVSDIPENNDYIAKEIPTLNTCLIIARGRGWRGARLPQHVPPSGQPAGPGRQGNRQDVHLRLPRLELPQRRTSRQHHRPDPIQGRRRSDSRAYPRPHRGVGGFRLRELRQGAPGDPRGMAGGDVRRISRLFFETVRRSPATASSSIAIGTSPSTRSPRATTRCSCTR